MARVTRRNALSTLAGLGLAPVVWTMAAGAQESDAGLRVLSWSGYQDEAYFGSYLAKHETAPQFDTLTDDADAFEMLRGGYLADVAQPCAYNIGAWIDAGLIRPLDTSRLRHWGDLWKPLRALPRTRDQDLDWFAPLDWGPASIIYRTDYLPDPDRSWRLMFDEAVAGRVAMQRSSQAAVAVAALALGLSDPWSMSGEDEERVVQLLASQSAMTTSYWTDPEEAEAGLADGRFAASYGWNDMYARLRAAGVPVAFMTPAEGYLTWVCGLTLLSAGQQNDQAAYDFIDAMLSPETGKAVITRLGYGHANHRSFESVPQAVLENLALSRPLDILDQSEFFDLAPSGASRRYDLLFAEALDRL